MRGQSRAEGPAISHTDCSIHNASAAEGWRGTGKLKGRGRGTGDGSCVFAAETEDFVTLSVGTGVW